MSDKLKPCPFCGAKPHPTTADLLTRPCFYYECENKTCHAAEKGWHDTKQEAIDAWNTRPIEDALQARIAELEYQLANYKAAADGTTHWCAECKMKDDRIAELEAENAIFRAADYEALKNAEVKPIYCAKCGDGIVVDDDGICGVCAGAQDGVIQNLQNKVAELKKSAIVWHRYPDEKPELNVKCLVMFDDGEPIIDSFDGFYWFDIEKTWVDRITHWAYLPEPPREEA